MVSNSFLGRSSPPPMPQFPLSKGGQPATDLFLDLIGWQSRGWRHTVAEVARWEDTDLGSPGCEPTEAEDRKLTSHAQ